MARNFFNDNAGLGIHFKPIGQWEQTVRTMQKMRYTIKAASLNAQIRLCKEIAKRVKGHLRNQDLPWRHLTPNYLRKKTAKGWDERMLIGSQTYYDSIKVITKGNQHLAYVGVPKGIYGPKLSGKGRNKLEVAQIAAIHEFSQNAKRRRPLWNPTIREMGGAKGIKQIYTDFLFKELRRKGFPVNKINSIISGIK